MSVKLTVDQVIHVTNDLELRVVKNLDNSATLWATWKGEDWAVANIEFDGVYLYGGFPEDFPIARDPNSLRVAVTSPTN